MPQSGGIDAAAALASTPQPRREPAPRAWEQTGQGQPMTTILIVDDEPIVREVVTQYLRQDGFRVEAAGDGHEALARFTAARPDLVLLDLMLPGIDGLEVCRRIRLQSNVPVIMLTAKGDE